MSIHSQCNLPKTAGGGVISYSCEVKLKLYYTASRFNVAVHNEIFSSNFCKKGILWVSIIRKI